MGPWTDPHIERLLAVGQSVEVVAPGMRDADRGTISAVLTGEHGPVFLVLGTEQDSRGYFLGPGVVVRAGWAVEHPGLA